MRSSDQTPDASMGEWLFVVIVCLTALVIADKVFTEPPADPFPFTADDEGGR